MRAALGLPHDHRALLIFDVFAAHKCVSLYHLLEKNSIYYTMVPANCTGQAFKDISKSKFAAWYREEILKELQAGKNANEKTVNTKLSTIKPLHCGWFKQTAAELESSHIATIKHGFTDSGIAGVPESWASRYEVSSDRYHFFFYC